MLKSAYSARSVMVSWAWPMMAICALSAVVSTSLGAFAGTNALVQDQAPGAPSKPESQPPPEAPLKDPARAGLERARALLRLFIERQFKEFCAAGTDILQARFTVSQAITVHNQISFQLGQYKGEGSAKSSMKDGQCVCSFELRFMRGIAQMRLVIDGEGRLSGFWLDKIDVTAPYRVPDYVDTSMVKETLIQVASDPQFTLKGVLAMPVKQGDGPFPGVVLVQGSGPQDEDETIGPNKPFKDLALGLASRGVIVLRYVKRTKAYPNAFPTDEWTPERETIDDAVAALDALRKTKGVDPNQVFLIGHSMGGTAAPIIAQKDGKLAGMVVLAANARPMLALVDAQLRYLALLDDVIDSSEAEQLNQAATAIATVKAGHPEGAILGIPAKYWARWDAIDPVAEARKLSIPMFLLQGERDYQVTMQDFSMWQSALSDRPNVKFESFPRLNHMFMGGGGRSKPSPEEYVEPKHLGRDVVYEIASWIAERTGRSAPKPSPAAPAKDDDDDDGDAGSDDAGQKTAPPDTPKHP